MASNPFIRILWLTENYPPQRGGMAVSCDRIVRSLRGPDLVIDLVHFSSRAAEVRTESRAHGLEITCPIADDSEHALNRLWLLLESDRPRNRYTHVVAFGGVLPMLGGPVFAAWLGAPLITLIRGNDFDAGIFSLKRADVLRSAFSSSRFVGAVSRDKVWKISALFPSINVGWTPNGIDLSEWELHASDHLQAAVWRKAHVEDGRLVIGLFGQLKRKKGGTFFLDALLRSGRAGRFHLLLIGDTDAELNAWLEAHRGDAAFTLLPFLDRFELLPHYAACDFVAIPSFYDGMPNVLLESAALGVPAIAANTGGMRDLLVDGENSVLFQPGDSVDCVLAIERAAALDPNARQRLGNNGRKRVVENFQHRREAERYLEVIRSIHPGQP